MGHKITDWMLKHGIAEWDPRDQPPPQRPEDLPKDEK